MLAVDETTASMFFYTPLKPHTMLNTSQTGDAC